MILLWYSPFFYASLKVKFLVHTRNLIKHNKPNPEKNKKETAILGGGCFWCLETAYRLLQGVNGVVSGYAGGPKAQPTYEEVASGTTGHAEVVKIEYDSKIISFQRILEVFFTLHDPTTLNQQGQDIGEQYRSAIFYKTERQKKEAEETIEKLTREKIFEKPIVTAILPLREFYPAEDYHQEYYRKNPKKAYCQLIINPKLEKMTEKFTAWLKK